MPKIRRFTAEGPLFDLLMKACPAMSRNVAGIYTPDPDGTKSLGILANRLGMSRWGVHKWLKTQYVPPDKVVLLVEIGEGRVKEADFSPYVFKTAVAKTQIAR